MAKYLDQAGLQLVLQKLTEKYDGRFLGLHATADEAQKVVHKLTINVRDEESRVFDGSSDMSIDVAQASHRHPSSEINFSHDGMSGVTTVEGALDVIIKNIQIANGALSSATANMNSLQEALDQEIQDRIADVDAEQARAEGIEAGLAARILILEELLEGSGNVSEAVQAVLDALNAEIERSKAKDDAHDELLEDHEGRLDVIEGEDTVEGSIKYQVKQEQERAAAREAELDAAIAAEKTRAEQAEQALQDAIDDEEEARIAADEVLQGLIDGHETRLDVLEGDANTVGSVAKAVADAEARVKVVTDALDGRATSAEARLDVIEGTGEGSIKKAVADLVDGAPEALDTLNELAGALRDNADVLTAIEEAFDAKLAAEKTAREAKDTEHDGKISDIEAALAQEVQDRQDAVNAEAAAREAADNALDARIDDIEALIGDEEMSLTEIREAIEANKAAIEAEADRAEAAEKAIQDQIDVINGDAETEGSFKKAIADQAAAQLVKDTAQDDRMDDIEEAIGVQGEDGQVGTGVHGRIDQEIADRESADSALEGRIADIEELIGDGEGSTTLADLNERLTTVEAEQLVQNQSIADNAAAIAAIVALEETDIDAAFSAVFQ